jgi:predicted  nucleic acid-binding Zn-ribbon protein
MSKDQILNLIIAISGSLLTFIAGAISHYMQRLTASVERLNDSMVAMNANMTSMNVKVQAHEKRLDRLERKI